MSLAKISQIAGPGVYVPGDDVDTDRVIPARYMKCITFDGLGEYVFYDERFDANGQPKPHPINDPKYAGATILLAGRNFGCGSSREHAPQSLWRYGFTAFVGGSFAEIFFGNSTTLGVPCLTLSKEDLAECDAFVRANPDVEVTVDVEKLTVSAGAKSWKAGIAPSARDGLINGKWDPIADLLEGADSVAKTAGGLAYVAGK